MAPLGMEIEVDRLALELEEGPVHRFRDWPPDHLEVGPSGVYTIWNGAEFLYTGMSYAHRSDAENPRSKGVFGRLASHASGRRSGDQFCVYVCDRFVIPSLTADDMVALASGERFLDQRTREFVQGNLSYRVVETPSGADARLLESHVRRAGLPRSGRPIINP